MDEIMMTQGTEVLAFAGFKEFARAADQTAVKIKEGFMEMGYLLKMARDTDILKGSEYRNYEEFAEKRYDLDKGTVSRYIRIVERFSVDGNSHILQGSYRNVGFAKLSLMLHLSDEVAEELMDKYSKADVQAVKEEIEAEQAISDIELAIESAEAKQYDRPDANMLEIAVRQLGKEQQDLYRKLWKVCVEHSEDNLKPIMEIFAPEGERIFMVRIPGTGKLMISIHETSLISVINVRNNKKEAFDIDELAMAVENIVDVHTDTAEDSYLKEYGEPMVQASVIEKSEPSSEHPAKEKRKQSKVVKSRPMKEKKTAVDEEQPELKNQEEEQLPGQMNVEDYPEILPTSYEEIDMEDTENADGGAEEDTKGSGDGDPYNQGYVSGDEGADQSDAEGSSHAADDADVISSGLGVAGDVGASGEVSDRETLSESFKSPQDSLQLWKNIRNARERVIARLEDLFSWAPFENSSDYTEMDDLQKAYDDAISLAAALELLLIARQREEAKKNG